MNDQLRQPKGKRKVKFEQLGLRPYRECWDIQEKRFAEILSLKEQGQPVIHSLFFCQHPHVFTLGRNGSEQNLLADPLNLQMKSAEFVRTNRGGDITYHGPGQLVAYPIFSLQDFGIGLKDYIHGLESAIIQSLLHFGIEAARLEGATGVWIDPCLPGRARKICAIGVRCSHWVTMHGFAFNIQPDLEYFQMINPCGFTNKAVTSMEKEIGGPVDFAFVESVVKQELEKEFRIEWS